MTRKTIYTACYVLILIGVIGAIANTHVDILSRRAAYIACMTILFVGLIGTNAVGFVEAKGNAKMRKFKAGMIVAVVVLFLIFIIEITTAA